MPDPEKQPPRSSPQQTVLHLRSSGAFLGAERVIFELSKELPQFGFRSEVCCLVDKDEPEPHLLHVCREEGIPAFSVRCHAKFDLEAVKALRRLLAERGVSVLHTHGYKADLYALLAGRNPPKVATNHLWKNSTRAHRAYAALDGVLLRFFPRVVAVSQQIFSEMVERGLKPTYIPNGINAEALLDEAAQNPLPSPFSEKASVKAVCVASLTPEKAHAYLIDAWLTVTSRIPDAELALIGDGPLRKELEEQVHHHKLGSQIHFLGHSAHVPSLLKHAQLFVLPSLHEGLPMALLEAMCLGLAIVATDVGETGTVVQNCGRVIPAGEVTALANALLDLALHPKRAEELAIAAKERVLAIYSAKKMAERYSAVYRELLEKTSAKRSIVKKTETVQTPREEEHRAP